MEMTAGHIIMTGVSLLFWYALGVEVGVYVNPKTLPSQWKWMVFTGNLAIFAALHLEQSASYVDRLIALA